MKEATYEDLLAIDEKIHAELIDGEIVIVSQSGASFEHQNASASMLVALRLGFWGPGKRAQRPTRSWRLGDCL